MMNYAAVGCVGGQYRQYRIGANDTVCLHHIGKYRQRHQQQHRPPVADRRQLKILPNAPPEPRHAAEDNQADKKSVKGFKIRPITKKPEKMRLNPEHQGRVFMKHRMDGIIQVRFPEGAQTVRHVSGDSGIFDTIAVYPQPQQFVADQQKVKR